MEKKEDYYGDNSIKKLADLAIGFFGAPFVNAIISNIFFILLNLIFKIDNKHETIQILIIISGAILLIWFNISIIKKFKKMDRRFISTGIIVGLTLLVLIPLLILGACVIMISGSALSSWNT